MEDFPDWDLRKVPVNDDWISRIILASVIIFFGWIAYRLLIFNALRRVRGKFNFLAGSTPARFTIVYFTTPDCAPCKTVQKPALAKIKMEFDKQIEINEINAYEKPEIARMWGVLSVPATFILDEKGQPYRANFGVTSYEKLKEQLLSITESKVV
jgi:thiol-disulfide isomerase/thioredoxin